MFLLHVQGSLLGKAAIFITRCDEAQRMKNRETPTNRGHGVSTCSRMPKVAKRMQTSTAADSNLKLIIMKAQYMLEKWMGWNITNLTIHYNPGIPSFCYHCCQWKTLSCKIKLTCKPNVEESLQSGLQCLHYNVLHWWDIRLYWVYPSCQWRGTWTITQQCVHIVSTMHVRNL